MMRRPVRSLGYTTDLMLLRLGGSEITDRGDYVRVSTHGNPTFHWGNLLLFRDAPQASSRERWMKLWSEEFGDNPAIKHVTFGWDDPSGEAGDVTPFVESGFKAETTVVLTASGVHAPPKLATGISIRRIANDEDWHAVQALQIECRPPELDGESYATFMTQRLRTMRKLTEALHGDWYGAFDGDLLVGDLGLFVDPATRVGRFQGVETRGTHRRRGICGALVHTVAERALQDLGVAQLVMMADADYHAAKIYESVGFRATEHLIGLCKT